MDIFINMGHRRGVDLPLYVVFVYFLHDLDLLYDLFLLCFYLLGQLGTNYINGSYLSVGHGEDVLDRDVVGVLHVLHQAGCCDGFPRELGL
jgi:hypothetical protein